MVTQEEKQLLLKDLCARLPYGVMMKAVNEDFELSTSTSPKRLSYTLISADFKPYLRPMSSMTVEEKAYYFAIDEEPIKCVDWLNKNHFDYRGLIPMGLALEAPEDMYKSK